MLEVAATVAVDAFFVMSGLVLARAYDRRPLAFVARRAVRLWPTYCVSMLAGFAVAGMPLSVGTLFWVPPLVVERLGLINLPAWTLYIEVWSTPVLVALFWIARRGPVFAWCTTAAFSLLVVLDNRFFALPFLAAGVALAAVSLPWPVRLPSWSLWLGKISFSLYISHWVTIHAVVRMWGPEASPLALPLTLGVAWLLWRWVERPSIALSRRVTGSIATFESFETTSTGI